MSFDKFLLAVESRDVSQADKSIIRVSSFPKLRMTSRTYFSVSPHLSTAVAWREKLFKHFVFNKYLHPVSKITTIATRNRC
jgi:hypothetical protein